MRQVKRYLKCSMKTWNDENCASKARFVLDIEVEGEEGEKKKETFGYCRKHWHKVAGSYKHNKTLREGPVFELEAVEN